MSKLQAFFSRVTMKDNYNVLQSERLQRRSCSQLNVDHLMYSMEYKVNGEEYRVKCTNVQKNQHAPNGWEQEDD